MEFSDRGWWYTRLLLGNTHFTTTHASAYNGECHLDWRSHSYTYYFVISYSLIERKCLEGALVALHRHTIEEEGGTLGCMEPGGF